MPAAAKDPEFRRRAVELARLREKLIAQIAASAYFARENVLQKLTYPGIKSVCRWPVE